MHLQCKGGLCLAGHIIASGAEEEVVVSIIIVCGIVCVSGGGRYKGKKGSPQDSIKNCIDYRV